MYRTRAFREPFVTTRGYVALYAVIHLALFGLMIVGMYVAYMNSPIVVDNATYSPVSLVWMVVGLIPTAVGLAMFASGEQIMDPPWRR